MFLDLKRFLQSHCNRKINKLMKFTYYMDYNKVLQELKQKYFPELKNKEVILKKRNQKPFMVAFPLNKYVYYNEKTMDKCNPVARNAAFVHELFHKLQFGRMPFIKRVFVWLVYKLSQKVRINIEREAHIETVKRGFGEGTILLNKYVQERVSKDAWENEHSKRHLTEKEIKDIMNK